MTRTQQIKPSRRGAEYLDLVRPNWFKEIDLDLLKMRNINLCILGQCFDGFWPALNQLVPTLPGQTSTSFRIHNDERSMPFAVYFGFALPDAGGLQTGAYERLGLEWKREIVKRRVRAQVVA